MRGYHNGVNCGLCPKCLVIKRLTRHHLLPVRHFGDGSRSPILHLCRQCHDEIEKLIPYIKLSPREYFRIARDFLKEG